MESLKYPIGPFDPLPSLAPTERIALIDEIAALPGRVAGAVQPLSESQRDTPYRPGGWTVRQLVHHLPDSHLNAYTRFKLTLTEGEPTIRPYDQDAWALLPDSEADAEVSLILLAALHRRWVILLRSITAEQWQRQLRHPESGLMDLDRLLQLYAWHGRHHLGHITGLVQRSGW